MAEFSNRVVNGLTQPELFETGRSRVERETEIEHRRRLARARHRAFRRKRQFLAPTPEAPVDRNCGSEGAW